MDFSQNYISRHSGGGNYYEPVSKPTSNYSGIKYSTSEGHKTTGMSPEYGQQSLGHRSRTNVIRQQVENFIPGNKRQSDSPKAPYSQRNSSQGSYSQKSSRYSDAYSVSNYLTGRADDKRTAGKPAASARPQADVREKGPSLATSSASVKTKSEPKAGIKEHQPRHLSEMEKKTVKFAGGILEMRVETFPKNYKKYLESAVDCMTSVDCFSDKYRATPKKAEITDGDFAEFIQNQRLFKKGTEKTEITPAEFNEKREALGQPDANSLGQVEELIDLLGGLGSKENILNIYRSAFTADMQISIKRAVYYNAIDRFSRRVGGYGEDTRKCMMSDIAITDKKIFDKTVSDSKSSGKFGVKVLDDLKISDVYVTAMGKYIEKNLTGLPRYSAGRGLLEKKSPNISTWSIGELKELFDDLHIVAEHHITKPYYDATKNVYVKPERHSGDYDIKRALRLYLRGGNYQFTDDDVLAQTSSYSHQLRYKGNKEYDVVIRELNQKYYDPRYGRKKALDYFHKHIDAAMRQTIRWKVVEHFVDALFALRDDLESTGKGKKTEGRSGAESSKESSSQAVIAIPSRRGTMSSMKTTFTSMLPKRVAKVTRGAESMMTKVTESAAKREPELDERFLKNSALNKVRRFINDMAEFQAVKKS